MSATPAPASVPPEMFGTNPDGSPVGSVNKPRCRRCGQVLAYLVTAPWRIKCHRCRTVNAG